MEGYVIAIGKPQKAFVFLEECITAFLVCSGLSPSAALINGRKQRSTLCAQEHCLAGQDPDQMEHGFGSR